MARRINDEPQPHRGYEMPPAASIDSNDQFRREQSGNIYPDRYYEVEGTGKFYTFPKGIKKVIDGAMALLLEQRGYLIIKSEAQEDDRP